MLAGEVKIEVLEWADAATGERNLPRHQLDETRIDEQLAALNVADQAPGRAAPPRSFLSDVDTNPDITNSDACTAGPRRFESDEQARGLRVLIEPPPSPVVDDEVEALGHGRHRHLPEYGPRAGLARTGPIVARGVCMRGSLARCREG